MSIELKVKAYTLAEEARYIRKQETRLRDAIRRGKVAAAERQTKYDFGLPERDRLNLHNHRVHVVRPEARLTHIARAFIRGKTYASVEGGRKKRNDLRPAQITRITNMVIKYSHFGIAVDAEMVKAWIGGMPIEQE